MRKTFQAILGIVVCLPLVSCGRQDDPVAQEGEELVNSIRMKFRLAVVGTSRPGGAARRYASGTQRPWDTSGTASAS